MNSYYIIFFLLITFINYTYTFLIRSNTLHKNCIVKFIYSKPSQSRRFTSVQNNQQSSDKLDFNEDYYSVLEVPSNISPQDLKKAYYKIVFKYHPDNKDNEKDKILANKQMMVINAAYKVLKDPVLREKYDRKRSIGFNGEKSNIKETKRNTYQSTSQTYENKQTVIDSNESNESFFDIFSEIWNDLKDNKGSNLFEDMIDFLEERSDLTDNINDVSTKSINELNNELKIVNQTIKELQSHLKDLKKSIELDKSLLQIFNNKKINLNDTENYINNEKEKLRLNENISSYDSRIKFVEKQINRYLKYQKKLNIQIDNTNNLKNRNNNNNSYNNKVYNNNNNNNSNSNNNSNNINNKEDIIEKELEKIKKDLGLLK